MGSCLRRPNAPDDEGNTTGNHAVEMRNGGNSASNDTKRMKLQGHAFNGDAYTFIGQFFKSDTEIYALAQVIEGNANDDQKSDTESTGSWTLLKYNLSSRDTAKTIEIPCEFNLGECAYCFDFKQRLIIVIHRNYSVLSIQMDDPFTVKLQGAVDPADHWTESSSNPNPKQNYAVPMMYGDTVKIFGSAPNDKLNNPQYECVPYNRTHRKTNVTKSSIQNFGSFTQCLVVPPMGDTINEEETGDKEWEAEVLCMGGIRTYGHVDPVQSCSDRIWRHGVGIKNPKEDPIFKGTPMQWVGGDAFYLPERMHSFGAVHVNRGSTDYLITFGGVVLIPHHKEDSKECYSDAVHILCKGDMTRHPKVEENFWMRLEHKLPNKDRYAAFVSGHGRDQVIELISYSGMHYAVNVDWMLDRLRGDKNTKHWTEGDGKTVSPTKIQKLKLKGPNNKSKKANNAQIAKQEDGVNQQQAKPQMHSSDE